MKIAKLPSSSEIPAGAGLVIAGFGIYQRGYVTTIKLSSYLRKSTRYVVDKSQCQQEWGYALQINDDQICTSTHDLGGVCTVSKLSSTFERITTLMMN